MNRSKRRRIVLAIALLVSITNYSRISKNSDVRMVEFLTIYAMGAITSLLIVELIRSRNNNE